MTSPQWHNERIRHQLKQEISLVIINEIKDPRIPAVVTIPKITLSKDMRNCTVYTNIYSNENKQKGAIIALNRAAPYIKKVVSKHLSVKRLPKLFFKLDTSPDSNERINELLGHVKDDLD